jgi:uncharacterized protein YegP (UPF0339 family)
MSDDVARLYRDRKGEWRWERKAPNGEIVAASSEGYVDEVDAAQNYMRVNGPGAPVLVYERPKDG